MKLATIQAALALLAAEQCAASAAHRHAHAERRHSHNHAHRHVASEEGELVEKRAGSCAFPDDGSLHRVPGAMNKGWAMAPDRECRPGMYCPIACKPGQVMAQWEPNSTYVPGSSMVSVKLWFSYEDIYI
jgi:hypothetical protein